MSFRSALRTSLCSLSIALMPLAAQPAAAQFYWSPPDMSAPAFTDSNAAIALGLPGATAEEIKAGLAWNLRAALNVAALQCQFEPTLLTVDNYNAMIAHHDAELDAAQATLLAYFQRTAGKGRAGQSAADMYNTRIYSGYSTVQAQNRRVPQFVSLEPIVQYHDVRLRVTDRFGLGAIIPSRGGRGS